MKTPPERKRLGLPRLSGGLAMFAAEAMVVIGLAVVAWLLSVVILAIL
ncbi:MAG: hypothetical protein ACRDVL_08870 [Acidimicrobiia bacterium]